MMDGKKAPHFPLPSAVRDPNQTTLGVECAEVQTWIFSKGFKTDRLTLQGTDGQPWQWVVAIRGWKLTCFCPGYGFTLKLLSFHRTPMVCLCHSCSVKFMLSVQGSQSLLIKTVEIYPMTLLPDSHLQYIPFMNQVFLPEALKLYI